MTGESMRLLLSRLALLLAGVIGLGYLTVWCLMPFERWREKLFLVLLVETQTKYFGSQSAFMLLFTIPILLIALLGCAYAQLTRNVGQYDDRVMGSRHAALKRPMLVRGPLGVVSAMELFFFLVFIALIIWTLVYSDIHFSIFNNMNARQTIRHANDKIWQKKLRTTGFYMAIGGNLCCAFLFFPVSRLSPILALFGLSSDGCITYHVLLGHIVMIFFTAHGVIFIVYWAVTQDLIEMKIWDQHSVSNVAGEVALALGLVLWVTTHPRIRRKVYELFYYTHHLYAPFMFFYMLHVGFFFIYAILPGFYLFLVDRSLRFFQSLRKVRLVSARILPCDAVELTFSKSSELSYTATSYVSINVPAVSSLQWHPFTVCSNSSLEPDKLGVIIKKTGTWSQKVVEMISSPSQIDRLEVAMEGPYGPVSTNLFRYETLVMVAGGSGISPMISIIRELIFRKTTPRAVLICAFKHSADLSLLKLILPISGISMDISELELEIEAFVTRDQQPKVDDCTDQIRTVWFKLDPSDEPLSAILGSYTWLWLGLTILISFGIYLAIIGVLGRYYIYPVDLNTNMGYSWTARTSINALYICASVIGTTSVAVLLNKRRSGTEGKDGQQQIEAESTEHLPSNWFYDKDWDLEFTPAEFISENTKVHYGKRPNLKMMLLEYKGASTGVLVCGPGEMREEVAAICSSGLADNLHYESISYTP